MRVILSVDVKALGKKGDIVNVSDGYANNYLLKNKLAVNANSANLSMNAIEKANEQKKIKEQTDSAKAVAEKLKNVVLNMNILIGDNGKTFGSISNKEIAEELSKLGYSIDKKKIEMSAPIKAEGKFIVDVKLYKGVLGKLAVVVTAKRK